MPLESLLAEYGGPAFPLPSIAGMYAGKKLIICGDAACIWDDLERLGCRRDEGRGSVKSDHDFMVINKLGETFPGEIEHWYSNEPALLSHFIGARRNEYRREFKPPKHTHSCNKGAMWRWPWGGYGSSGLSAILAGLGLGYDEIVLCGVPLDDGPHNGEPPWRKSMLASSDVADTESGRINMHWRNAIKLAFDGKVRSMSGRTKKWL